MIVGLVACARGEPVPLTFAITEFAPDRDFVPGVTAHTSEDGIQVAGALHGSLCASAPAATALQEGQEISVRVSFGRRTAVPCPAVARALRYDVTIPDLGPGRYDLRVVHVTRGLKRNRQEVLAQRLQMP